MHKNLLRSDIDTLVKTYNDDSAGDGDSRQHAMSDGVWFDGVLDALIVTVDASFIWLEQDVHNDKRKCSCSKNKPEEQQFHEIRVSSRRNLDQEPATVNRRQIRIFTNVGENLLAIDI